MTITWVMQQIFHLLFVTSIVVAQNTYMGAVVEHGIVGDATQSISDVLDQNLRVYEDLIAQAADHGAQVIVFPELGLNPLDMNNRTSLASVAERVPSTLEPGAAGSDTPILQRMSAAAELHGLPVLVNMADMVDCDAAQDEACPADGYYLYNTNVLFDATGALAARYHKSNEWPGLMPPYDQATPKEYVTWTAPFGVEFGIFTCFDIYHQHPPVDYINAGISHFLYPVKQGELGEDTVIKHWSAKYSATLLSSNLASDRVHDCSDVIVSGEKLEPEVKLYARPVLTESSAKAGRERSNVIIAAVPM